jgi:hypothetical protein
MKKRRTRLQKLQVDRVDLVDVGANQHASIPLFKRADTNAGGAGDRSAIIDETVGSATSATVRKERGADVSTDIQMSDEVAAYIEELQDEVTKLRKQVAGDDAPSIEDIAKGLPEEVRKAWEADRVRAEEATAALAAERVEKRSAEFVAKADTMPFLGKADEVGPVLQSLADAAPEAYGKLESLLEKAAPKFGELFKESGTAALPATPGDPKAIIKGASAIAKADQLAAALVEKEGLTEADAKAEVWKRHPDLYAEYDAERRS